MSPITFNGKTYNSESEMPQDIRKAYQEDQVRKAIAGPPTEGVEGSSSTKGLPITGELHRPSAPKLDHGQPTVEPDTSLVLRGLFFGILMSLILIVIVFLVIEFFQQLF
jgi:hypothetical protein